MTVCFYSTVRLNQILSRYRLHVAYGTVEVFVGEQAGGSGWGLICDQGWSDTNALVVCKQLGYKYGRAVPRLAHPLWQICVCELV